MAEFLNSQAMAEVVKSKGINPQVGYFTQDKFILISYKDGVKTVTQFESLQELQKHTGVIFGTATNVIFSYMNNAIDSARTWSGIMDEADAALVDEANIPLIVTGKTEKEESKINILLAEIVNKLAVELLEKYKDTDNSVYEIKDGSVKLKSFVSSSSPYYEELKTALKERFNVDIVDAGIVDGVQGVIFESYLDFKFRQGLARALTANVFHKVSDGKNNINYNGKAVIIDKNSATMKHGQSESYLAPYIAIANGLTPEAETLIEDQITLVAGLRAVFGNKLERLAGTSGSLVLNSDFIEQVYEKEIIDLDEDGGEAKINAVDNGTVVLKTEQEKIIILQTL